MKKYIISSLFLSPLTSFANTAENPERVEVLGNAPSYQDTLSKVLPQSTLLDETNHSIDSLATLLSQSPEINLNGQGGLLQAVNIRGFARWRVQMLVEGIPIYTERRAGTAAEFLSPDFVGQVYLTAGAASTQLGSGAIGGGLDIRLDTPEYNEAIISYATNQGYRSATLKGSAELPDYGQWSWMASHRHANQGEDGSGNTLFDQFEQQSFMVRNQNKDGVLKDSFLLYSATNNIGKASSDLPENRVTLYPTNDHLMAKTVFDWHNTTLYFHDSKLDTQVTRPGSRVNRLSNESMDIGLQLNDQISLKEWLIHWRVGLDARTGVKAYEQEIDNNGLSIFDGLNLDAEQWEAGFSIDTSRPLSLGTLVGGARLAYQRQTDNLNRSTQNDTNNSMFLGYNLPLDNSFALSFYASTAYRVPSLTERFFSGSTPRGQVLGDATLETEEAVNLQTTLQYETQNMLVSFGVFHQEIDNYIERVRLSSELRQYRNLDSADIQGINYKVNWGTHFSQFDMNLVVGGQWLKGEDTQGNPIADISPPQHRASVQLSGSHLEGFFAITLRQSSYEQVSGELPTAGVTTFDAGLNYAIQDSLSLSLNLSNLTDKQYVTSRDDLAPLARGRDISVSLSYLF